jgi:hypothetical protein
MSAVSDASLVLQKLIGSGPDLAQKGVWDIAVAYVANDVVTRTGNTYVNILANTGSDPVTDAGVHWVVIRTGITSAAMTALSDALINGFAAMVTSRQSRRVGLLNGVVTAAALPCNVTVDEVSLAWNENTEARAYLARAQANDQNLGAFRVADPAVKASLVSAITPTQMSAFATLLIDSASDFASLTAESLPA